MSFPETGRQRRERARQSIFNKGYGSKRPHNNRTGQPMRKHRQDTFAGMMRKMAEALETRLRKNKATPVCPPYRETANAQDKRWRRKRRK